MPPELSDLINVFHAVMPLYSIIKKNHNKYHSFQQNYPLISLLLIPNKLLQQVKLEAINHVKKKIACKEKPSPNLCYI